MKIQKKDLSTEIDEFIKISGIPSYLTNAIDAIRIIGNFAVQSIKNTNTGEIVEVEDGEAEWLLEVIDSMFDFLFIQPEHLKKRREKLNEKLRAMGRNELKNIEIKN
jgi:hypothetical protein